MNVKRKGCAEVASVLMAMVALNASAILALNSLQMVTFALVCQCIL